MSVSPVLGIETAEIPRAHHLAKSGELVSFGFSKRDPVSKNRIENN